LFIKKIDISDGFESRGRWRC